MKAQIARIKKALIAAGSMLISEVAFVMVVGDGEITKGAFGAAVALAAATGWAVYFGKNKPSSDELRRELEDALAAGR